MALGKNVKLGVAIPQVFPEGVDMALVRDFAEMAEEARFHSLWVQEQVAGSAITLEPLGLLSYVAGQTEDIYLGVSVVVLPLHNPVYLAKQIGALDQMSQGRAILGMGMGGPSPLYAASGTPPEARVRRFTESLEVMKALWTRPLTTYEGRLFKLKDAAMEPKPVQRPHPPVWFGGGHPDALKRAVRHGDGWMGAGGSTLEAFRTSAAQVKQLLLEAGVDPTAFAISKRVYLAIDDDRSRAEQRLRAWCAHYYRNADTAARVCIWGSAAFIQERLQEFVAAGADHLLLNPVYDQLHQLEALSRLLEPDR
ncbi:MAG: LLM class flavin-dependent oxidoreductase [Chloroflexi bacterium]|nr:LLM class flavin-dependent oxidoreductase [Chloroflexota bacterium]